MMKRFIALLFFAGIVGAARAETPEQIPDPRRAAFRGSIVDEPGKIDGVDRTHIEDTIRELRRDTGAEMLVAVIQRTDGRTPKQFATRLFNLWGIGDRHTNHGVLYLIVLEARRMEVEVGIGLENQITPGVVDPLLVERVVPYFRRGDVSSGVRVGTEAVAGLVRDALGASAPRASVAGLQPGAVQPVMPVTPVRSTTPARSTPRPPVDFQSMVVRTFTPDPPIPAWSVVLCWVSLLMLLVGCRSGIDDEGFSCARSALILILASCLMVWAEHRLQGTPPSASESLLKFYLIVMTYVTLFPWTGWTPAHTVAALGSTWVMGLYLGVLAGVVMVGMTLWGPGAVPGSLMHVPHGNHELQMMGHMVTFVPLLWMANRLSRYVPPVCGQCNMVSYLLSEEADDAHLTPGELKEEQLGSVDYDVWVCPGCSSKEKRRHAAWVSSHSSCSRCSFVTVSTDRETIRYATYDSSGQGKRTDTCLHCRHTETSYYTIPRKRRSSSSSSSSSRSSSGGGRSSGRGGGGASW